MESTGRGLGAAIGAALLIASAHAAPTAQAQAVPDRPSIVVIYADDTSPLPTWLWSDPVRTPTLARFVRDGTWFSSAIGATPMCCPARGNLLTGRYGHSTGITRNDMDPYDPQGSLAVRLDAVGYHTAYVGKYLNGLARHVPTAEAMTAQAVGWDDFDVIWENQGAYYHYRWWTRDGVVEHAGADADHSSLVAARAAAAHIRDAPADAPLFMVVSLFDGHPPNRPMRRFHDVRACRDARPWRGPAFDEADVSDKPAYVRRTGRLRTGSKDLRERCEAMMTTDFVAGEVRVALEETGRLEDTLFVFTADNGTLLGDHRLRSKGYPYATPVPLYMLWPARLRDERREITEPVSNVDLGPTFCAIAGCTVPDADGLDLGPLLDGAERLERDFVYEEMLHADGRYGVDADGRPAWYGLRTTGRYDDRRWVYTEYETGERELYDLSADPSQLRSRAGLVRYAEVEADLRAMLHEQVVGPDGVRFLGKLSSSEEER